MKKTKSFQEYIEKRLPKETIAKIKKQAKLEAKILLSLQNGVSTALAEYMEENDLGFNDLVRLLNTSPSQITKIQKGQTNLTFASFAHIFALIGKEPSDIFKKK